MMKKMDLKHRIFVTVPIVAACLSYSISTEAMTYGADKFAALNAPHSKPISVQIGAFRSANNANRLKAKWQTLVKYPVYITHTNMYYRVIIGPIPPNNVARFEYHSAPPRTSKPVQDLPKTKKLNQTNRLNSLHRSRFERGTHLKASHETRDSRPKYDSQSSDNPKTARPIFPTFDTDGSWYIGLDGGLLKPHTGSLIVVHNGSPYVPPEDLDHYSTQSSNQGMMAAEIGYFWRRHEQILPGYGLGLRYQHLFNKNISGRITQYSLPEFENYDYTWRVSADVLSAYTKLQLFQWGPVMPYINGGVGVTLTQSGTYTETADSDVTARYSPAYASGKQTNFAYDVGVGLDYAVNHQLLVSLGYDFQSLGAMQSGRGVTTWSSQRLNLGKYQVNTALLGVSFLFDKGDGMKK